MAVLTLETPTPYTISYTISDMTPEYVDTAKLVLYEALAIDPKPIRTIVHRSIDVAHTEKIFGFFGGLVPNRGYKVQSTIYDKEGNVTSYRENRLFTPEAFKGTLNSNAHSIEIVSNDAVYNTFENWGLVPSEEPSIMPPELKAEYVELPSSNGVLDYTEILLGTVPFGRRIGSWKFYTDEIKMASLGFTWDTLYNKIVELIHGQSCTITLDDDLNYYYKGRLSVNHWKSLAAFSEIVIDYNLESYKYSYNSSDDYDWLFDEAIEDPDFKILYGNYSVQEFKVINFTNDGEQPVTPNITVVDGGEATVQMGLQNLLDEIWKAKPVNQTHPELYQYLIESNVWPGWDGLWGNDPQRSALLNAAGFNRDVIQASLSSQYYGFNNTTNVTEDGIMDTTRALMRWGYFSGTDDAYKLISGENYNPNITLYPGVNIIAVFGEISIDTKYSEVSL